MAHKTVNRYIRDNPMLDDVDHALGRPADPFNTYRSHYVVGEGTALAEAMASSPWWDMPVSMNNGNDLIFHVTKEGRDALAAHLIEQNKQRNAKHTSETGQTPDH